MMMMMMMMCNTLYVLYMCLGNDRGDEMKLYFHSVLLLYMRLLLLPHRIEDGLN
jgi:hypothetical protein